jgi:hypothetical protein
MQALIKVKSNVAVTGLLLLALMTGCAEWNSKPVVTEENFGRAVKNMVKNQTLYPEHGRNDNPILTMDGQKAQRVIEAYRQGASEQLDKAKEAVDIDINKNTGSN